MTHWTVHKNQALEQRRL